MDFQVPEQANRMKIEKRNPHLWTALLVAAITLLTYLPTLQNGFVNWDDGTMVYDNPYIRTLTFNSWRWANLDLWIPLTMFSFAFDSAVWGLNPKGFHLSNIFLHTANTLLVYILIVKASESYVYKGKFNIKTIIAGIVTSLLFGIHPMHVESVAWITERKDVLYSFFFLLSLISYLKYTSEDSKKVRYYFCSLIFFTLSLMSKPMAVSLPAVLLVLDLYPLKRLTIEGGLISFKAVLVEKIPFLLLGVLFSLGTLMMHRTEGSVTSLSFLERIFATAYYCIFYLIKMFLPFELVPLYDSPLNKGFFTFNFIVFFITFVIITFFSIRSLKRGRLFFAIWVYYLVTLAPVTGITGDFGKQTVADHFIYMPSLGPFILAGLFATTLIERCSKRFWKTLSIAAIFIILSILGIKTVNQIGIWKDSLTLWSYEIKYVPNSALAYYNRGTAYGHAGKYQESLNDFDMLIKLAPKYPEAYYNRGTTFEKLGEYQFAIKDFEMTISNDPKFKKAYNSLGGVHLILGNYSEAVHNFDLAIKLDNRYFDAYYNRGIAFRKMSKNYEAIKDFDMAIDLAPQFVQAYYNRGSAFMGLSKYIEAIKDYNKAIELIPNSAEAYYHLGTAYLAIGNAEQARIYYKQATELGLKPADDRLRKSK